MGTVRKRNDPCATRSCPGRIWSDLIRPSTFSCGRDPPGLSRRRSRAAAAVGQPSPPVVLVAPFLKAYRAPFGSTSVEASSPSRSHISRKCECAAAHSLRSADHHLAMKSTTRTIRGNVTGGSEASTTVPANPACCYHSIRKNHEFISHTPQTQDPPPATLPIRCRVVLGRNRKAGSPRHPRRTVQPRSAGDCRVM